MSELAFDLVEDILMRLNVEDLIRCKSVCKSWLSFISSSSFVNIHLKYHNNNDHNNPELGHRRIIMPSDEAGTPDDAYFMNCWHIVGSSNGLVCVSPRDAQILVTNPSTREVKKLQPPPKFPKISMDREFLCWGFGHDSSTDDYKVVMGIKMGKTGTLFQVLSLKSNIWKLIGKRNYEVVMSSHFGFLWNGALHWFMKECNTKNTVILSFDLSKEKFQEIPQPDDSIYECDYFSGLGILKNCLCIFRYHPPHKRWIMKNYNDKESWCLCDDDWEMNKHDTTHTLDSCLLCKWYLSDGDGICLANTRDYIGAPIFVRSLVSPHLNGKLKKKRHTKNNKRNLK